MELKPTECRRCRGRMVQGFLFDFMGDHGRTVAKWTAGVPTKSFWMGVKVDTEQLLPVGAFRCVSCGLLELYARPEFEPK